MAAADIVLQDALRGNPEIGEALVGLLSECDGPEGLRAAAMQPAPNALMSAEADAACGAAYGERSEERVSSRNGYRGRPLKTGVGDLELRAPKLGSGTYHPESLLARWDRAEASLAALVVEAYVNGVSARDVSLLASEPGVSSASSSEVSRMAAELDAQVGELRSRDPSGQRCRCLWVDATHVRRRVGGRSVSQAAVGAIALGEGDSWHRHGVFSEELTRQGLGAPGAARARRRARPRDSGGREEGGLDREVGA